MNIMWVNAIWWNMEWVTYPDSELNFIWYCAKTYDILYYGIDVYTHTSYKDSIFMYDTLSTKYRYDVVCTV